MSDALAAVERQLRSMDVSAPERAGLEASLLELVINDPATGLRNRRSLDQALRTEWRRAARRGEALGLVLIELAAVPDDAVLARVGRALGAGGVRGEDTVARYGPASFAALLPACDADGAVEVSRRLRARLAAAGVAAPVWVGAASLIPACGGQPADLVSSASPALRVAAS